MNKIPFSVYDFFGYLACGFLLLAAVDFAYGGSAMLRQKLDGFAAIVFFWIVLVYILGHLIANFASFVLESTMVRRILGPPEELLFRAHQGSRWSRLFPGYYAPLPKETRERVLEKARQRGGSGTPGPALFFHCHPIVKRDAVTLERLNNFLNAYGFCRNVSLTALLAAVVVLGPVATAMLRQQDIPMANMWWAIFSGLVALGMFYRYLKFFRLYTVEVFITYAETNAASEEPKSK